METTSSCEMELKSLLQVTDSSFDLTPEEEDVRYGPSEELREEARRLIGVTHGYHVLSMVGDPRLNPSSDFVWDGWQAAYLLSKQENSKAVVQTSEKSIARKRKFSEILYNEEGGKILAESLYIKERVLAVLASPALSAYGDWLALESVVGKIECNAVQENMFDCFAKFVLSILDEGYVDRKIEYKLPPRNSSFYKEDMERIFFAEQLQDEYEKFCREICADGRFRDFSSGELGGYQFFHLTECDIYEALMHYKFGQFKPLNVFESLEEGKSTDSIIKFRSRASQLIKEHRPLKRHLRVQVLMEHTCLKCYHVTDSLILEAIHGLNLPELSEKYVAGKSVEDAEKLYKLLGDLAETMYQMTNKISLMKSQQAVRAEWGVLRPPMYMFGRFSEEVHDVLRIANYERKMGNERFITLSHILTGLSCSRVAAHVPEIRKCASVGSSSELLIYKLIELTDEVGERLGAFEAGLEHFVTAIVNGPLEQKLYKRSECPLRKYVTRLRDCQTGPVRRWKNVDVFTTIAERRCRARHVLKLNGSELIVKLDKDLKSGRLILPSNDDFRV